MSPFTNTYDGIPGVLIATGPTAWTCQETGERVNPGMTQQFEVGQCLGSLDLGISLSKGNWQV
jgi:hypothetical protein